MEMTDRLMQFFGYSIEFTRRLFHLDDGGGILFGKPGDALDVDSDILAGFFLLLDRIGDFIDSMMGRADRQGTDVEHPSDAGERPLAGVQVCDAGFHGIQQPTGFLGEGGCYCFNFVRRTG